MAITLTCPDCEQSLKLQDDTADGAFNCPRCGTKLYLGDPDEIEQEEQEEEERKRRRKKKGQRKKRDRIEGLATVSKGLGIHYAGIFVFMVGSWVYWLAFGIMFACMFTGMPDVHAFGFLSDVILVAVLISAIATLIEVPAGIMCVMVPDGSAKGLAISSVALRFLMILIGVWYVAADFDSLPAIVNGLLLVGTFFLWMCFLRQTAVFLGQPGLARDVISLIIQALLTALAIFTFLFFASLLVRLLMIIQSPLGRAIIISSFAGPLATLVGACYKLSGGDSVLKVVLYPTGIPFLLRYLEFISSLRVALLKRA